MELKSEESLMILFVLWMFQIFAWTHMILVSDKKNLKKDVNMKNTICRWIEKISHEKRQVWARENWGFSFFLSNI